MNVQVKSFPCTRNTKTINHIRSGSSSNSYTVAIIYYTITIYILIFNISRLYCSKFLFRAITNIIIILEKSQSNQSFSLIYSITFFHLVWIYIVFFIFFQNGILAICDITSYSYINFSYFLAICKITIKTFRQDATNICSWSDTRKTNNSRQIFTFHPDSISLFMEIIDCCSKLIIEK